MQPKQFTLSPKTVAAIEQELTPFLAKQVDGQPLANWLNRPEKGRTSTDRLPPALRVGLGVAIDTALGSTEDGQELLSAFDRLADGSGAPAMLIHGLDTKIDATILREAFRLRMLPNFSAPYDPPITICDTPDPWMSAGFQPTGVTIFHKDRSDTTLLFGECGGANPRHTELLALPEWIDQIAQHMNENGTKITPEHVAALLKEPLFPIDLEVQNIDEHHPSNADSRRDLQRRLAWAEATGQLRYDNKNRAYGPLLYDNPHYNSNDPDSPPYWMTYLPFTHLVIAIDKTLDTGRIAVEMESELHGLCNAVKKIQESPPSLQQGPVLREGDLLLFNNHQLLHAGGGFLREYLPARSVGGVRAITSLDTTRSPDACSPAVKQVPGTTIADWVRTQINAEQSNQR